MLNRREFLSTVGAAAATSALAGSHSAIAAPGPRKTMAIVTTVWRYQSHGQHMGDRFLHGYPMNGKWQKPGLDVVSLYVDQTPKGDLSRQRAEEFGFKIYPSISDALCRGGKELAVDAVLVIGEHGDYPDNEYKQRKYPRYEFFKKIVEVFERDKKVVPVFNDKHLSWNWDWAKEMVDTSHAMGFPYMAGSSLPVTWRLPAIDLPWESQVEEAMGVAYGGVDSYDFRSLEVIQCMVERRKGGESGVAWVEAIRGPAVWNAHNSGRWDSGGWNPALFEACISRSQTLAQPRSGFTHWKPTMDEIRTLVKDPVAYRFQYNDGTRATMLLLNGLVSDFTFAANLKGKEEPISTLFHLPPTPNVQYSAILMSKVEEMFLTGKPPYPVERTLLTSGILASATKSLTLGKRLETPHLSVRYQAPRESVFCQT
jgi:hypothetical protein